LPELLWRFTAWIEIGIGLLLVKLGSADSGEAQQ
jgi:hypothetical protein